MSTAGTRHELARYQLPDGTTRALVAQRIDGRVAITDLPTEESETGRVYLVERAIESQAAMRGLVHAYLEDAQRRGEPPVLVPSEFREAGS